MSDHSTADDPYGWQWFEDLYRSGAWEPRTKSLIDTLQPGDLFVDVGAWIGPVTRWALARGAQVIAVEPDPVALPELLRRVPDAVEVWQGAVAIETGTARIAPNPKEGGFYGDSMSRLAGEGVEVPAWTLQEILNGRIPRLVKIDVEGYETELCPALMPWLAEQGVTVQVSFHGTLPERGWFAGFSDVQWPADSWGDLVARP